MKVPWENALFLVVIAINVAAWFAWVMSRAYWRRRALDAEGRAEVLVRFIETTGRRELRARRSNVVEFPPRNGHAS